MGVEVGDSWRLVDFIIECFAAGLWVFYAGDGLELACSECGRLWIVVVVTIVDSSRTYKR